MSFVYPKCPKCGEEIEIELEPSDRGIKNHMVECECCGHVSVIVTMWGGPPQVVTIASPGEKPK